MGAMSKIFKIFNTYPITRGILAYGLIFPSSSLIQQTLTENEWKCYDWKKVFRFWIYGTFFLAPIGYGYVRIVTKWFPGSDIKTCILRVVIDQTTYSPLMTASFFGGMALLEGKGVKGAKEGIQQKFLPTYKVGLFYWPIIQTVNFTYIPEKNRVPFISVCGMAWTLFLAFVLERNADERKRGQLDK